MNAPAKKKQDEAPKTEKRRIYPVAYALYPDPDKPGWYFALELHNVTAERVHNLELSGRSSNYPHLQLSRITSAMNLRHHTKQWGGNKK